ncbi:MAG: N-acetyltransferase [Clostridia bacterium]|nr:N-acetyltransferase [Clostridia bacterium]
MENGFEIIDYEDRYKSELLAVSMPWLEGNDILEEADIEQLEHPERVLESGGRILLARVGDDIAGMMMLELFGNGTAEPFKFGVKEQYRGRGIGKALLRATIDAAKELGQHKLVLTSHHSLKAALHVYESFGFRYEDHDNVAFELSDISMVKDL